MYSKPHGLIRIFTDEAAVHGDRRLFEIIVERAREHGLMGATVLRGRVGYGREASHPRGFLDHNYPLVIEIVDDEDRLRTFAASLEGFHGIGLATLEKVEPLIGGRGHDPGS